MPKPSRKDPLAESLDGHLHTWTTARSTYESRISRMYHGKSKFHGKCFQCT